MYQDTPQGINKINLKGVLRNIQYSHTIGDIEYNKADLITTRKNGKEDVLSIRFKKFSNPYQNNQQICLCGNIRSYSKKIDNEKNKVELYVFTYFDVPQPDDNGNEIVNEFEMDGRICKIDPLVTLPNGKQNIHFILANNLLIDNNTKLNSYIPLVVWDGLAKRCSTLQVNDRILIKGELHSREYKKSIPGTNEYEIRVAHEGVVTNLTLL